MRIGGIKATLTDEQLKFERENRDMGATEMAKIFKMTTKKLTYSRWVIKQREKPPADARFFNVEEYTTNLGTI